MVGKKRKKRKGKLVLPAEEKCEGWLLLCVCPFLMVPSLEPRASCMLGKCSATKPHSQVECCLIFV